MSPLRRIHTAVVAVCRGRIFITMSWGNDIVPAVPRGGAITMAPGHCDYGASHANGGTSPAWSPCDSLWVALALRHRAGEEEGTGDIYSCCIIRSMLHADMDLHNFWCIHKFRCMFCVLSPVAWFAWVWFALSGIIAEFQGHFCAFFFKFSDSISGRRRPTLQRFLCAFRKHFCSQEAWQRKNSRIHDCNCTCGIRVSARTTAICIHRRIYHLFKLQNAYIIINLHQDHVKFTVSL